MSWDVTVLFPYSGFPMRLLLADDHILVRDALAGLLRQADPDMDVLVAGDLNEALTCFRQDGPFDVVILDLRMPGMNGLDGVRRMIGQAPDTAVVLMSGSASPTDVQTALELGIKAFVPKTLTGRSLINAIRLAAEGEVYVPVEMLRGRSGAGDAEAQVRLTPRELQVLAELRRGNSNKEIARTLEIAEATAKLHVRSLCDKLNARNRTEAVMRAIEQSLV